LDKLFDMGLKGGQRSDGSQKDGFLKYEKGRPVAIYDPEKKDYVMIEDFAAKCDEHLGPLPESWKPWKAVNFNKKKDALLETYFSDLNNVKTVGASLAKAYNAKSNEIGRGLVERGVANNEEDVNTVMLTGFFHAYGPINNYLK
jgi:hypothetical protein